jgi:hypothetical protein
MGSIEERAQAFLRNVTTRAPVWYASPEMLVEDDTAGEPPHAPPRGNRAREAA